MADDIDKMAENLQEEVFEGFSKKFMEEALNPHNVGMIENPDTQARITGICGDTIEMYLTIKDEKVEDIKFTTDGCGSTLACASYVTRNAKGKTIEDAFLMKPESVDEYFEGLPQENKHCAKLAIVTLRAALDKL